MFKAVFPKMLNESFADLHAVEMYAYLGLDAILDPVTQDMFLRGVAASRGVNLAGDSNGYNWVSDINDRAVAAFHSGRDLGLGQGVSSADCFDRYASPFIKVLRQHRVGSGYSVAKVPEYPTAVNELEKLFVSNVGWILSQDPLFKERNTHNAKESDDFVKDKEKLEAFFAETMRARPKPFCVR